MGPVRRPDPEARRIDSVPLWNRKISLRIVQMRDREEMRGALEHVAAYPIQDSQIGCDVIPCY